MKVDTLIIGSGVAATVVSETLLAADPKASILILEAGTRVKTKDFGLWENYLITNKLPYEAYWDLAYPQRDVPGENVNAGGTEIPLNGARLFTYGGSTMHWGGWAFRLKPEDFELKSRTKEGLDWPFGYETLERFYCRAENHLAVSGDSADPLVRRSAPFPFRAFPYTLEDQLYIDAMDKLGIGHSRLPIARRGVSDIPTRHAPCQTTGTCKYCPFGARYVASNYLDDMREWNDFDNLMVKTGAVVLSITMDGKRRAKGARYWDRETDIETEVEAGRVVIAGGAIESAKLLQRSTSGDWTRGVGNDHDQVGRYFITHPYFIFTATLPGNPERLQPEMNFPTLVSRHFDNPTEQPYGKFVLVAPPDGVPFNFAQRMQRGDSRAAIDTALVGANTVQIHGMVETFGRATNQITNVQDVRNVNRVGLPMTTVNYTKDDGFDARMAQIQAHVTTIFDAMGATKVNLSAPSWRADHAACTTRMSVDETSGVVDADLRVHSVDNLFVISNGVFPNLGCVNPTLTLTALAYRLGDHLVAMGKPA
jgi:choline dehydrogenase-like flavoprotein